MSTISIYRTELSTVFRGGSQRNRQKIRRLAPSRTTTMDSKSLNSKKSEEISIQLSVSSTPQVETLKTSALRLDRLQPPEQNGKRLEFGEFVARDAVLDEEYWTAAWLRAESHWENRTGERYVDNYKRKYTEQEFNAIKRRCSQQQGHKCMCIVAVKKEEKNVKRTVIKSVVGTLDLSIRYLMHGETFPEERIKSHVFCSINRKDASRYGYIANVCVAKSARRQGIARNMLAFAIESAKSNGVEEVYVHVDRKNVPAQDLYQKMGFEMIESLQSDDLVEDPNYLLRFKV